jgi:hypothetical protein
VSPSIARLIVCSLIVFRWEDENESRNRRCNQRNNCDEDRMSKLRHGRREHLPAIMRCQECQERVSDNSAGRQRHQEFPTEYCIAPAAKTNGTMGVGGGSKAAMAIAPKPQRPNIL